MSYMKKAGKVIPAFGIDVWRCGWYEEYWTGAKNGVASTFTKMEFVPPNVSLFRVLPVTKKEALEKTDSTVD